MVDQGVGDTPRGDSVQRRASFDFGAVFNDAFHLMFDEWKPLVGAMLLLVVLPLTALLAFVPEEFFLFILGEANAGATGSILYVGIFLLGVVFLATAFVLFPAVVTILGMAGLSGRRQLLGDALRVSIQRFLPLSGAMILMTVGSLLGLAFFIVPGIILASAWYVVMGPAAVEEQGPIESLRRSWELTDGYKWSVFLVLIVSSILGGISASVLEIISADLIMPSAGTRSAIASVPGLLVSALGTGVETLITSAFIVSTYHHLRVLREGTAAGEIADIFG